MIGNLILDFLMNLIEYLFMKTVYMNEDGEIAVMAQFMPTFNEKEGKVENSDVKFT